MTLHDTVNYPPACKDKCKLPDAILRALDYTLAANCSGPKHSLPGEARIEIVSRSGEIDGGDVIFGGERPSCRNPRALALGRDIVDRSYRES